MEQLTIWLNMLMPNASNATVSFIATGLMFLFGAVFSSAGFKIWWMKNKDKILKLRDSLVYVVQAIVYIVALIIEAQNKTQIQDGNLVALPKDAKHEEVIAAYTSALKDDKNIKVTSLGDKILKYIGGADTVVKLAVPILKQFKFWKK
jgi:uncharacterized protein YaeQ